MSQYESRVLIRVLTAEDFAKLHTLNWSEYNIVAPAEKIFPTDRTEVALLDLSCDEVQLEKMVQAIATQVKTALILADTTNINEDPYEFGALYLGEGVTTFTIREPDAGYDMFHTVDIRDVKAWLAGAGYAVAAKESRQLKVYGIDIKPTAKAPKQQKFSVRFYLAGREFERALSSTPWLGTKRSLVDELDARGEDYRVSCGRNDMSFEVPQQTQEAIAAYLMVLSKQFYPTYALAWDGKMDHFLFLWPRYGKIMSEDVPFEKLGLKLGENLLQDHLCCLEEVVDMCTLPDKL